MKAELAHASPEQAAEEITHELIPSTESLPAAAPTTIAAPEENEEENVCGRGQGGPQAQDESGARRAPQKVF
ncbi:hypothetical protein BASA81_001239 [Batrachochytrium salamandrivorans]|nr:hypothetical protein BASA81_001239 [Batrachochytrium salamandrivorans]